MTKTAQYKSREIRVMFYNGAGYVVRHDMYPHTHFTSNGPVTKQGNRIVTGIRQGTGREGAFTFRDYVRADTEPAYVPPEACGCADHGYDVERESWPAYNGTQ